MRTNIRDLRRNLITGPFYCDKCKELTAYADVQHDVNHIFCRNPSCDFERIVDKRRSIVREDDGTFWKYDGQGNKVRIRGQ